MPAKQEEYKPNTSRRLDRPTITERSEGQLSQGHSATWRDQQVPQSYYDRYTEPGHGYNRLAQKSPASCALGTTSYRRPLKPKHPPVRYDSEQKTIPLKERHDPWKAYVKNKIDSLDESYSLDPEGYFDKKEKLHEELDISSEEYNELSSLHQAVEITDAEFNKTSPKLHTFKGRPTQSLITTEEIEKVSNHLKKFSKGNNTLASSQDKKALDIKDNRYIAIRRQLNIEKKEKSSAQANYPIYP